MSSRRCQSCGAVLFGRSDKRYCSSTCRRDACRARTRIVQLVDGTTFIGSEWAHPVDRYLIPALEREYGPNHRIVHRARRAAEELDEEKLEEIRKTMETFSWESES